MTLSLTAFDKRRLASAPALCGVDEAGRGCFAGPVVAAAVRAEASFYANRARMRLAAMIDDSKQLSPEERDELFELIVSWEKRGFLRCATGFASTLEIDVYNILGATRLAMTRAVKTLEDAAGPPSPFAPCGAADDPLFAGDARRFIPVLVDGRPLKPFAWEHEAIVGGDGKSLVIAMASIVAKVTRDRAMAELDRSYPHYGFAAHKGYGVPDHALAIRKHGPCPEHRRAFIRNLLASSSSVGEAPPDPAHPEFGF